MASITKEEALALASHSCRICCGAGILHATWQQCACNVVCINVAIDAPTAPCIVCRGEGRVIKDYAICRCVHRSIFRSVWDEYLMIQFGEGRNDLYMHKSRGCSRPSEEFCADVELVARRALRGVQLDLFTLLSLSKAAHHEEWFRLGAMQRLRLTDRSYFIQADELTVACGKAFRNTEPYALYPTSKYFREHYVVAPYIFPEKRKDQPLTPPLAPDNNHGRGSAPAPNPMYYQESQPRRVA